GQLLLSHVCYQLSVQLTCTLLCLGSWSQYGYIKDSDVEVAFRMPDVLEKEEELEEGWDHILL
ncbi:hypothetical protein BDQ17DRAFT_1261161, partial [Cyathus striatus]